MTAPRTVGVLVRAYNDAPYLLRAIDSALTQDYEGKIEVLVGIDAGSTDGTPELVARTWGSTDLGTGEMVVHPHKHPRRTVHLVPHPHMTLAAATRFLLPKLLAREEIFLLDGDNTLTRDRVKRHIDVHPGNEGLCCCNLKWGVQEDAPIFPNTPPGEVVEVSAERLLQGNFLDTLSMRWRSAYLRDRILPLMSAVAPGDLVDDYLMALLAARDGKCDLHGFVGGTYRFRDDSLTRRTNVLQRTADTLTAYQAIVAADRR